MRVHESISEAPQPSQDLTAPSSRPDRWEPADPPADPASRRRPDRSRRRPLVLDLGLASLASLALLPALLACAPRAPLPFWSNEPELVEVEKPGPGRLFVKRDHLLDRYDDVLLEDVGFRYRPGQERLALEDEQRILAMLVAAVEGNSEQRSVARVSHPGPCVLAVDYLVKDLELAAVVKRPPGTTEVRRSLGRATLVLELRDSQTDVVVARFVERRDLGGGRWLGGRREQLARLETVIGRAVDDLGRKLRRIAPATRDVADAGRDELCHGTILRVAHESD